LAAEPALTHRPLRRVARSARQPTTTSLIWITGFWSV
jgi:hypothetical protein